MPILLEQRICVSCKSWDDVTDDEVEDLTDAIEDELSLSMPAVVSKLKEVIASKFPALASKITVGVVE